MKSYNKNLYLGLVSTGKIYWSHRAICINRIQQFIKIELTMHTNILNIQSPKEKMHRCMVEKIVSNTETTIGFHQQVQLLVIKIYGTGQTWQS